MYVCVHVCVRMHVCGYLWRPEEVARAPEAGVTGGCEPSDMSAGNRSQVLAAVHVTAELCIQSTKELFKDLNLSFLQSSKSKKSNKLVK